MGKPVHSDRLDVRNWQLEGIRPCDDRPNSGGQDCSAAAFGQTFDQGSGNEDCCLRAERPGYYGRRWPNRFLRQGPNNPRRSHLVQQDIGRANQNRAGSRCQSTVPGGILYLSEGESAWRRAADISVLGDGREDEGLAEPVWDRLYVNPSKAMRRQ